MSPSQNCLAGKYDIFYPQKNVHTGTTRASSYAANVEGIRFLPSILRKKIVRQFFQNVLVKKADL